MIHRMIGATLLLNQTYEEIEADPSATKQALLVVVLVALATGISRLGSTGIEGLVTGVLGALAAWALWVTITYFVGTTMLKTPQTSTNWGEMARSLGFAQSPGVLKALAIVPLLGPTIFTLASLWQLVAMVVAIRAALDYQSLWRAVAVALVGFIPYLLVLWLLWGVL
jgi:hypothetical protein